MELKLKQNLTSSVIGCAFFVIYCCRLHQNTTSSVQKSTTKSPTHKEILCVGIVNCIGVSIPPILHNTMSHRGFSKALRHGNCTLQNLTRGSRRPFASSAICQKQGKNGVWE